MFSQTRLTLAVVIELAVRPAIIPRWMFFNQQNFAEFSHLLYEMVSCSRSQSLEIASHPLTKQHPGDCLSKTRVFERVCQIGKVTGKSGLNLSQNSFLISASQKERVRLSFERGHDDQTDKDRSHSRAGEAATFRRGQGHASAIIRCRRHHVEADADRLCPRVDRRPEPCLAARCPDRSRVRQDFHRADVGCGYRPAGLA